MSRDFSDAGDETLDSLPPLLGALLRFAWQKLRERLLKSLLAAGYSDLNAAHLNVFQYPPPDGVRPIDLAQRASMTRQAMNYLLVQLESGGYVTRGGTGSSSLVSLTPRGREVGLLLRSEVKAVEAEWSQALGKKRFDDLVESLKMIASLP